MQELMNKYAALGGWVMIVGCVLVVDRIVFDDKYTKNPTGRYQVLDIHENLIGLARSRKAAISLASDGTTSDALAA